MSRVLGRFRARRLLPRAMEPPPALGFLLPPFLPCYTRFSPPLPLPPLGAPGGDRRATAKAGGGPPRTQALLGQNRPSREPWVGARNRCWLRPPWVGCRLRRTFPHFPPVGVQTLRARPWPPGRPGRWAPTAGSTLPPAALCTWPAFRTPCPPLPGAALVTAPSKSVLPPPAATSSPLHALEPESP